MVVDDRPGELPEPVRVTDRLELMAQVLDCEACELHEQCTAPVFMSTPASASRIAILGEAPGEQEDEQGAPFVGPSGQLLREALKEGGIDPDTVSFVNAVSCFPHGTPDWPHIHACAGNREAQLAFSEATYVLCVGKVATKSIEPALEMEHGRARPFLKDGRIYFSTYHPAAALRNGNYEAEMNDDIKVFAELCQAGADRWLDFVRPTCAACPKDMYWMQESGLTWCLEHTPGEDFAKAQAVFDRNQAEYESLKAVRSAPAPAPEPNMIDDNSVGLWSGSDPDTSKRAALAVFPKAGTQRRAVYDIIAAAPDGLTDDEIARATKMDYNSFGPRRRELVTGGWVFDSGRERPGDSGVKQMVWLAKPGG
jgi:uracil-DNA glycosylase family 4